LQFAIPGTAESVTDTETNVGIEKTEKYRKTENSAFADDDIHYLNYIHFSPLKLRNEDLNVH